MGAGAKHSPGQHTFEHRVLADAEQPGNHSPDLFTEHNQSQSAGANFSKQQRSGNFKSNRHRHGNVAQFKPARHSDTEHRNRGWQQLSNQHFDQFRRNIRQWQRLKWLSVRIANHRQLHADRSQRQQLQADRQSGCDAHARRK